MNYTVKMTENEYWWGGSAMDGINCPFDRHTDLERDFRVNAPNQSMPMYLSDKGRCIWSDKPFYVKIKNGVFEFEAESISVESFGETLRDAYKGAMKKYFPPKGKKLPEEFFEKPQYNTWMQYTYSQTQENVLKYASDIIKNGYAPGIFIIDEGWQKDYGIWEFDESKFPDPKEMIKKLHEMGFTVMLWLVPYVSPNGERFIKNIFERFNPELYDKLFLRTDNGEIAVCSWWNGYSAVLDMTKQCDIDFLDKQLTKLMNDYGADGFKFDGGNIDSYCDAAIINGKKDKKLTADALNIAWNDFGTRYSFHEYKDTFKGGGKRTIQRMCDRSHSWTTDGLETVIPAAILQGLLGYPFICPDMVGGGEFGYKALKLPVDEELFVRMAQCSALFPMMQFSWAPWEAVSEENNRLIKEMQELHIKLAPLLKDLIEEAYKTGEPIIRNLEYNYPHKGYHKINDVFMLGEKILAAPAVKKGQKEKTVLLPPGKWRDSDGNIRDGGKSVTVDTPIDKLLFFCRV